MGQGRIVALYRYPVKGFSAEPLERVAVAAGGTFPKDRAFAIENGDIGFDPAAPRHFPKARFLMLMRNERMATCRTRYDDATGVLSVSREGREEVAASLQTAPGRAALEAWLAKHFAGELRGPPRILSAPGHSFSDRKAKVIHIVNLASLRAFEAAMGRPVDPLRFRPNVVIDGAEAWSEFGWVGRRFRLGGISAKGESRTTRCAATNVDPETARRDMEIPRALEGLYGHTDFGIYAAAEGAGTLAIGDLVKAPR